MDFGLSDEQRALRDTVRDFARRELSAEGLLERDHEGAFDAAGWQRCGAFGIQGLALPEAYGGGGRTPLEAVLGMESLGHACLDNGLLFALSAQMWSVQVPILAFGSEAQKARYLPRLASGQAIGAHAVTEPEAGSDVHSLRTTATRDGDGYRLSGGKTFITSAPLADLFLVMATLDHARGASALTAFLVDRDTPGLSVGRPMHKMGLRTAPLAEVYLDDCYVPADCRLGKEGAGQAIFATAMEWERAFILAPALGTMQRQLEQCVRYARLRRQFGKPIGQYEAVSSKIADMQVRLETARLLLYRTAWLKGAGRRLTREPAEVKLYVSEAWVQTAQDAVQVHGGSGYMVETGLERDLRDALASKIYSGTSEIQRVMIASFLGL